MRPVALPASHNMTTPNFDGWNLDALCPRLAVCSSGFEDDSEGPVA